MLNSSIKYQVWSIEYRVWSIEHPVWIMFTCTQCGQDLPDEINFCSQCGSRINGESCTGTRAPAYAGSAPTFEDMPGESAVQQRLMEISRAMNSTLDLDILLKKINVCACELTRAETGSTLLYDPKGDELYFKVALGEKEDILRSITVRDGIAWQVFTNGRPAIVNDTASNSGFTGTVDRVTGFDTRSILCVPIILTAGVGSEPAHTGAGHRMIGVIEVFNKVSDPPQFTVEDQRILSIFAYQAAIALRNARAAGDRRNFFINAIEIFITAIESTEFVPPGHCMRVARSSIGMAHRLGVERDDLHSLYYASALHDIGVLDIRCRQSPPFIPLIPPHAGGYRESGSCPESHTIIGAEMVRPVNLLARTEPIIRHHHEAWDGSGYPDGIREDDIPLGARIVAVAEAYEEMMRAGCPRSEFIAANAGKLFAPDVVDAFLEMER